MVSNQDSNQNGPTDEITLVVFKDNYSSRSFRVPLKWLSRIGWIAGTLIALTWISTLLAIRFYYTLRRTDPSHVQALEQELASLKSAYQTLESKKSSPTVIEGASPIPSLAVSPPLLTPTSLPSTTVSQGTAPFSLASLLPTSAFPILEPSKVPITLESMRIRWSGKTLKVRFSIHYSWTDKGAQQGSIVILAHGPETLLSYPSKVLPLGTPKPSVNPRQGERFSVSRFRAVEAQFGPVSSTDTVKKIEILIFNSEGQIIIHQTREPETKTLDPDLPTPAEPSLPSSTPPKRETP